MRLKLGGYLSFYGAGRQDKVEVFLKEPVLLSTVLENLGIPVSEIYLTVVNGELVTLDKTTVSDSDEVALFPPIDGG